MCSELNIPIIIKDITCEELFDADEIFFTGTASEVTPVISVNDKEINNGNVGTITSKLKETYMDIVLGKSDNHLSWLTTVK